MKPAEIIGMLVFGFLCLLVLVLALRQGARHRREWAEYAARHGRPVLGKDPALQTALAEAAPAEIWYTNHIIAIEPPPEAVTLFCFQSRPKKGSSRSNGTACLAGHSAARVARPVTICSRTPGLDRLLGGRVAAGSEAFRREFTVLCEEESAATGVVSGELERALLEHAASPCWRLDVVITARSVLVSSSWARGEKEWDHLIALARTLRASLA